MEKNFNLQIDVKKAGYNVVRGLKQRDNNSVLNVTFTQNSLPFDLTNLTVRANYKRPDHHIFLQETTIIEPKKGQIKINILTQALEFAGEVFADLSIFEGDRKITSVSFSMFVDASVYRNDYIDPEQLDIIQKVFINEVKRNGETSKITEDYLKYKNIMTAESNVAALQNNIDKITNGLGGRNLVLDSLNLDKKFMKADDFEGTIQKIEDVYPISKKAFKVECTKDGGYFHFPIFQKTNEKVGRIYTFSFYLLSTQSMELSLGHQCGGGKTVYTTQTWQKVVHTWKYTDEQYSSFYFMRKDGWKTGDVVYIADLKIEEGTVQSTHTNAPEDMEKIIGDISTLKTADKLNLTDAINSLQDRKSPIGHEHAETDITSGFGQWLLPNGYRKSAGGLILQWGMATAIKGTGYATGNFPTEFPTECFSMTANVVYSGAVNVFTTVQTLEQKKFNVYIRDANGAIPNGYNLYVNWIAIGF